VSPRPSRREKSARRAAAAGGSTCTPRSGACRRKRQPAASFDAHQREMDLPHRERSLLAVEQGDGGDAQAVGAAIETLAIIAYHQPVTRAEIEDISRGETSKGWSTCCSRPDGSARADGVRRRAPRPTAPASLPVAFRARGGGRSARLEELKELGLLDGRLPPGFSVRCRQTTRPCATTRIRWNGRPGSRPDRRRSAPASRVGKIACRCGGLGTVRRAILPTRHSEGATRGQKRATLVREPKCPSGAFAHPTGRGLS